MRTNTSLLLPILLAACGGNDGDVTPDATPDVPLLSGDFSCVGQPRVMTAPDPLTLEGKLLEWNAASNLIAGATVEIHSIDDDSLIGQTTTASSPMTAKGGWRYDLATGGVARGIYRKFIAAGFLDHYEIDPWPQWKEWSWNGSIMSQSDMDQMYALAGLPNDGTTSIVQVEVADCNPPADPRFHDVEGATIEGPPGAKVIYAAKDVGYESEALSLTSTQDGGQALIVGVPPGRVDITVHAGPITYRPWTFNIEAHAFANSPRHP